MAARLSSSPSPCSNAHNRSSSRWSAGAGYRTASRGSVSIFVNIPRFRLLAFKTIEDRESDMLAMNVIVGKSYPSSRTPVFAADMKYIIFRPYWDVPYSITVREMLPAIRNDPAYLARQRLEIVAGYGDNTPALAPTPENLEALARASCASRQQPARQRAPAWSSSCCRIPTTSTCTALRHRR
mgnify:CR=1 FL=1